MTDTEPVGERQSIRVVVVSSQLQQATLTAQAATAIAIRVKLVSSKNAVYGSATTGTVDKSAHVTVQDLARSVSMIIVHVFVV